MTMEPVKKYVAYYRVSTDRQGKSGLGLETQQQAVQHYLQTTQIHLAATFENHHSPLVANFTEIESGKKNNRKELHKAIALCKKQKAILIIAKLDRLARNVRFVSGLMESRVDFVAVDNPHANKLMIHMLAAFAEHEREMISQRTKAALSAAKARGITLGLNGKKLAKVNSRFADIFAQMMTPIIKDMQNRGISSLRDLAAELNRRDMLTSMGNKWYICSLSRLLNRIEGLHLSS